MGKFLTYWFDPTSTSAEEMYVMEHAVIISAVYQGQKLFKAFMSIDAENEDHLLWMVAKN